MDHASQQGEGSSAPAEQTWQASATRLLWLDVCKNAERLAGCCETHARTAQTPSARMRSELIALRRDMVAGSGKVGRL